MIKYETANDGGATARLTAKTTGETTTTFTSERNMTMTDKKTFNISEEVIQVKLSTGYWSGVRRAKELAEELEARHATEQGTVKADLFVLRREDRLPSQRVTLEARAWFNGHSLPWGEGGWRIVRVDKYAELMDKMSECKTSIHKSRDDLVGRYDELLADAKVRLNGLFYMSRFPTKDALSEKYHLDVAQMPIARTDDIRLNGFDEKQTAELRKEIEASYTKMIDEAQRNIIERLVEVVAHAESKLNSGDGVFWNSLIKNIGEVCDVLPSLNITRDPKIGKLIEKVKTTLAKLDPDTLRADKKVRTKIAKQAGTLLNELKGFGA